ncbi:hypothetical protein A2U01_0119320, partial [Trifolium medium]|nr:hypothetical protein [Trifolium medium]
MCLALTWSLSEQPATEVSEFQSTSEQWRALATRSLSDGIARS